MTYLDHAATTPMRPEAREAMLPWLGELHGNPSGAHAHARLARRAVDDARELIADLLAVEPGGVTFTSGGTEADNLAVLGSLREGARAVCSAVEHQAVLDPVRRSGGAVIPVHADGTLDLDRLADALDASVGVVSVMTVNNETGVLQPLDDIATLVAERAPRAVLHTDAVQALTWCEPASATAGADLISLGAHKFGGPQGVGALAARREVPLDARQLGGGQERGLRSGTHNVAGIVGMAAAAEAAQRDREATVERVDRLRARLTTSLGAIDGVHETCPSSERIPGIVHACIDGVESEELLFLLDRAGISASAGSACSSGAQEPSHVLAALGVPAELAKGALRISLGWTSTDADVDALLDVLPGLVEQLRERSRQSEAVAP